MQCDDLAPHDVRSRRALAKEVAASKRRRTSCGIGTITIAKGGGERGSYTIGEFGRYTSLPDKVGRYASPPAEVWRYA